MSPRSTDELVTRGALVALRDGSHVRIRQGQPSDGELIANGFEHLGPESRYRRFLTPLPRLSGSMLRHFTAIDHHDHEAIVALDEQGQEGLGIADYFRDPSRPNMAEVAVTVVDHWQGRGLGSVLLEVISARARAEGIDTFTALVLADNRQMLDLFEALGRVRVVDRTVNTLEVEVAIPDIGLADPLRGLLPPA